MRVRSVLIHITQAIARGSLIALLVVALAAGTAFAAKGGGGSKTNGGHGGSKHGGTGSTATVSVSPNPVPAYSEFQAVGCGYPANAGVQLNLYTSDVTAVYGGIVDANGCLYNAWLWANAPSSAKLDVLLNSKTLVASTTFTIQ